MWRKLILQYFQWRKRHYMLSKHLVNLNGKSQKAGRSGRIIMTNEARVLRELRVQSGLSMRKAGELIGCSDSYISHIENGRTDVPTENNLDKFLKIYGDIKQKSFYERVRNFELKLSPIDELVSVASKLDSEKMKILLNLSRSL